MTTADGVVAGPAHFESLDLVRMASALLVVVGHSFPLTGHTGPLVVASGRLGLDLGAVAVGVFFSCSGYLISQSWERDVSPYRFVVRRAARIWPGFAAAVLVSAFVVGLSATRLGVGDYLLDPGMRGFVLHNLVMAPITFPLPGVFVDNADQAVNGSLWTLPYEVLCYGAVLAVGAVGLLRRRWLWPAALALALVAVQLAVVSDVVDLSGVYGLGLTASSGLHLASWFLAGMCLYRLADVVPWSTRWIAAAAVVAVGSCWMRVIPVFIVAVAYLALAVGRLPSRVARAFRRHGDPSYGTYLYGFPIQQMLVAGGVGSPVLCAVIAAPLATCAGYASWRFVERPAQRAIAGRLSRAGSASGTIGGQRGRRQAGDAA